MREDHNDLTDMSWKIKQHKPSLEEIKYNYSAHFPPKTPEQVEEFDRKNNLPVGKIVFGPSNTALKYDQFAPAPIKYNFIPNDPSQPNYKYDEGRLLKEFNDYIANTYKGHYVGEDNIQSLDLIFAAGAGRGFCQGNVLKYAGPRLGVKGGPKEERSDILKVMHYAMLLLYLLDKKEKNKEK